MRLLPPSSEQKCYLSVQHTSYYNHIISFTRKFIFYHHIPENSSLQSSLFVFLLHILQFWKHSWGRDELYKDNTVEWSMTATTVNVPETAVFWDITLCSALKVNWCFREECHLHLHGSKQSWIWTQQIPLKHVSSLSELFINTTVRTSDPALLRYCWEQQCPHSPVWGYINRYAREVIVWAHLHIACYFGAMRN
jgi:hypothetical protein